MRFVGLYEKEDAFQPLLSWYFLGWEIDFFVMQFCETNGRSKILKLVLIDLFLEVSSRVPEDFSSCCAYLVEDIGSVLPALREPCSNVETRGHRKFMG